MKMAKNFEIYIEKNKYTPKKKGYALNHFI